MAHVLVVDDDDDVRDVVCNYLRDADFRVSAADDGPPAIAQALSDRPDLIVLDLMLPTLDGFTVLERLRSKLGPVPVIMLTARDSEDDRIHGLEVGADDYLTKPFSPRELVLRVQSIARRTVDSSHGVSNRLLTVGDLSIDTAARTAHRGGKQVLLTTREFDLLAHLASNPGVAFSRAELMRQVWQWEFGDDSTVTVHIRRLREKVEPDPATPRRIVTVWGVGYRWDTTT